MVGADDAARRRALLARLRALPRPSGWLAKLVAGTVVLSWLLVLVAWLLLPTASSYEIVIPAGTAERLARGEDVAILPPRLLLRRGDTLLIRNQDSTVHRVGPAWAEPGRTTRTPIGSAFFGASSIVCSIHPGGAIGIAPEARPGVEATLLPTLILAVPLTIATAAAVGIARRLDVS